MKKLNHTTIRLDHFTTVRGQELTQITLRVNGNIEGKYLQIEVNELDVEQTPREKIEAEIKRFSIDISNFSYASRIAIKSKIEALELALTYL